MSKDRRGALLVIAALALRPAGALAGVTPVSPPPGVIVTPPPPSPVVTPPGPTPVPGQYVVVLKETAAVPVIKHQTHNDDRTQQALDNKPARDENLRILQGIYTKHGIPTSAIRHQYADVLVGFSAVLTTEQTRDLGSDPAVEGVYQDQQAKLALVTQVTDADANSADHFVACGVGAAGGPIDGSAKDTWIWILDTGIDLDHPDLNVQTSAPYPASFVGGSADDGNGHGTHVAGIAAAEWNTIGPTGVSAGAVVVPVKVFSNDGSGDASDLIAGLDHVAKYDLPNDVVNLSLVIPWGSACATDNASIARATRNAAINLGLALVWVVCAAGNDADCDGATFNLPACTNAFRVVTVAALECDGSCPQSFGSWGASVDWAATGGSVYSTFKNGGYGIATGTSMAAPIVAGILHARPSGPVSAGTVTCCNSSVKEASLTSLSALKFDVDLELDHFVVRNVRDLDGTEDLFGEIDFTDLKAFAHGLRLATDHRPQASRSVTADQTFWSRSQTSAKTQGFTAGTSVAVNKRVTLATDLTFEELRNIELKVGGKLSDDEGLLDPRIFFCHDCDDPGSQFGERTLKFIEMPGTLTSIGSLLNNGSYQDLKFGGDRFFELNFYESGNQNDGWEKFLWKVWVKPHA